MSRLMGLLGLLAVVVAALRTGFRRFSSQLKAAENKTIYH